MGHPASVVEDLVLIGSQKAVQSLRPVLHGHRDVAAGLIFRIVQIHGDDTLRRLQFLFGEVVLGNRYTVLLDLLIRIPLPGGQPHVGLFRVGPFHDQFRRCVTVDGPVELVLHLREEQARCLG